MQAETTFDIMGSTAHLLVVGPMAQTDLDWARNRLHQLETRWTRFSPDSELSLLNGSDGHPVMVSADTYRLIDTAVAAWRQTNGRYDPTLLSVLADLGYDRSFETITRSVARPAIEPTGSSTAGSSTAGSIDLNPGLNAITLPAGTAIDPGGIGKGLAADIIVEELLDRGAAGVMVNLGGDLRVAGAPPNDATAWTISVADPFDRDRELLRLDIAGGAVATSSRLERRWTDDNGDTLHHIIDPRTQRPVANDIAAVTVVAGTAWWAEALTKAVFTAGAADGLQQLSNASGVIVDVDRNRHATPDLQGALR